MRLIQKKGQHTRPVLCSIAGPFLRGIPLRLCAQKAVQIVTRAQFFLAARGHCPLDPLAELGGGMAEHSKVPPFSPHTSVRPPCTGGRVFGNCVREPGSLCCLVGAVTGLTTCAAEFSLVWVGRGLESYEGCAVSSRTSLKLSERSFLIERLAQRAPPPRGRVRVGQHCAPRSPSGNIPAGGYAQSEHGARRHRTNSKLHALCTVTASEADRMNFSPDTNGGEHERISPPQWSCGLRTPITPSIPAGTGPGHFTCEARISRVRSGRSLFSRVRH